MTKLPTRRPAAPSRASTEGAAARPVVLATLDVPLDARAAAFAVDAATETGAPLHVVNAVERQFVPTTLAGWDYVADPEIEASLRAPCELAASLGVAVDRVRLRSPSPVRALLELTAERGAGLLVFGPDPARLSRRRYRRAAGTVRERAACLVWTRD